MKKISAKEYLKIVKDAMGKKKEKLFVLIGAPWCPQCHMIGQAIYGGTIKIPENVIGYEVSLTEDDTPDTSDFQKYHIENFSSSLLNLPELLMINCKTGNIQSSGFIPSTVINTRLKKFSEEE